MNPIPPHLHASLQKGAVLTYQERGKQRESFYLHGCEPGNKETSISLHSCGRRVTSSSWIEDKDLGKPHQFHSMSGRCHHFSRKDFLRGMMKEAWYSNSRSHFRRGTSSFRSWNL